ncbi:MAG TPA: hypothetical protein VEC37_07955 [Bacillota bacterium]|nr:hypothetical protein [Bacillota bacterium]
MRKFYSFLLVSLIIVLSGVSTVCWGLGSPAMDMEKAYKTIGKSKGNSCFIVGRFTILHKNDPSIADPKLVQGKENINTDCLFNTCMELVNLENNKKYELEFKPIPGSVARYYFSQKKLEENAADPYWILEVPQGNYELDNVICKFTLRKDGFMDYNDQLFNIPVARLLHKKISIQAKPNQIVYIGDFQANLTTHFIMDAQNYFYPFRKFNLEYSNNFESAKSALINGANDKIKEKLNQFEIVSIIES